MTVLSIASGLCMNSLFSRIFWRSNFSPYICLYLKNAPYINLNWKQIYKKNNSLIHSSYFRGLEYKIIFCNKHYIFPNPQIAIL